jgi:cell division protease FtsH
MAGKEPRPPKDFTPRPGNSGGTGGPTVGADPAPNAA